MNKVRLGDVCTIQSGGTPSRSKKEYWDGSVPWMKISDLNSKYIYSSDEFISVDGLKNSSAKIFPENTILFTIFATLGEVAILKISAATNQAIAGLKINDDSELDIDYLYYFLLSLKSYVDSVGRGVAQNNINMSILKSIEIPVPSIETQRKIAYKLDEVNHLIDSYNNTLNKLDELVKSRFVEMFGNVTERRKLKEYAELITKGASPKWQGIDYADEGTLFVTSENVREGYLDFTKKKYLPNDINKILPRSVLRRNDILINIVNASIGRVAVYDSDELANINQAVALVRLKPNVLNISFLLTFLNSDEALRAYGFMKVGGDKANLSLRNISDLMIPVVDLEQQQQFANFVTQTDKLKLVVQKSLEKLETLKKSLMQEYFG